MFADTQAGMRVRAHSHVFERVRHSSWSNSLQHSRYIVQWGLWHYTPISLHRTELGRLQGLCAPTYAVERTPLAPEVLLHHTTEDSTTGVVEDKVHGKVGVVEEHEVPLEQVHVFRHGLIADGQHEHVDTDDVARQVEDDEDRADKEEHPGHADLARMHEESVASVAVGRSVREGATAGAKVSIALVGGFRAPCRSTGTCTSASSTFIYSLRALCRGYYTRV